MADDTEKKGATSAIVLLVLAILVGAFVITYGLQTLAWAEWKVWAGSNPWLKEIPAPLPAPAADPPKGALVKAFDFEFDPPWKGDPKIVPTPVGIQVRFDSGQVIFFFDPETSVDSLRKQKSAAPLEYQKFVNLFSDRAIDSNYALYDTVYNASPAQLSPTMQGRDAMRMNVLLNWKLAFGYDIRPEIRSFTWGKIRGFQFGDPATDPAVAIRAFDDRDRQFRLIFLVSAGSSARLQQDEIAAATSTLRPVPILEK